MKNRWLNLLFVLLSVLIGALCYHLFLAASSIEAASLIINILKPLNILLFLTLFYILFRNLFNLYIGTRKNKPGFKLQARLVFGILPLTLVPSMFLFILATRFADDIMMDLVIDPNQAGIIESSEELRQDYLATIGNLQRRHGEVLLNLCRESDAGVIVSYLDQWGLEAVEYYPQEGAVQRYLSSDFNIQRLPRVEQGAAYDQKEEPQMFDDGILVTRFLVEREPERLFLVLSKATPFTEKFLFIRDSYAYLRHAIRKTEKVKGLNQGIMLVATMAVLFGGVWTGMAFARRFLSAFHVLISGAEQVSKGNFDTQLELKTGDEIEDVVHAFNSMTRTLKSNQTELQQKARDLGALNSELSSQIQYSNTILKSIKTGILSTDPEGLVLTINPAAFQMLGLPSQVVGRNLMELLDPDIYRGLLQQWESFLRRDGRDCFKQQEFSDGDRTRYVSVGMLPLSDQHHLSGYLIVMEDLTQLLNAQKLAAWQEVARRVAHEIKNPLTPIQLSIQRIRRKAQKGAPDLNQAIESAHDTIMSETNLLKNLVNEFSTFAKMPEPVKTETNLQEILESVRDAYQPALPEIHLKLDLPEEPVRLSCDANQIRQVLTNLIQNAADASQPGSKVTLALESRQDQVTLRVADLGCGIPESERERIFVPYYSRSPKGTGLGLAIVKRIIEDHDGQIEVSDNQPQGTLFTIRLPRS